MTHHFTDKDWKKSDEDFKIEIKININEDKPLIQLYTKETQNGVAIHADCHIEVGDNIIILSSVIPVNGYVVIK
ncbi:hypothetical protein [Chryseobacterium indoltheticum]|uniref:Uncharacterized protein n=1 Tax=Chryseobacterium indoltheticum TaxID=254 RepID=A0A381FAD9_9FLAO|nr:hypothetical protein [Chryseobacterium indoltheticum]AZA73585.1 hypothetical protein EG358_07365 [Chryseobacterium indoltheticum]SIR23672.1 hypothetical protein SAMN05421682_11568 [Chryseobacterium indoltheticum]SUX43559.1 Uncharacterised protein [Chryseobacterium indoltheticum]